MKNVSLWQLDACPKSKHGNRHLALKKKFRHNFVLVTA